MGLTLTDKHKKEFLSVLNTLEDLEQKILLGKHQNKDITYADVWALLNFPYSRFGLEDEHQSALMELGKGLGFDFEESIQIEARALRKLNHPNRSKRIENISPKFLKTT